MRSAIAENVRGATSPRACRTLGGRAAGQSVSPERRERAKAAKRLAHAALRAADITQEQAAAAIGVSPTRLKQCLSPLPEHAFHDLRYMDMIALPDEALRVYLGDILDKLGEESRPIADAGDGALLRAVVGGLKDAAFVLRAAHDEELLAAEDEAEIREAALELMALLGALAHRCSRAKEKSP